VRHHTSICPALSSRGFPCLGPTSVLLFLAGFPVTTLEAPATSHPLFPPPRPPVVFFPFHIASHPKPFPAALGASLFSSLFPAYFFFFLTLCSILLFQQPRRPPCSPSPLAFQSRSSPVFWPGFEQSILSLPPPIFFFCPTRAFLLMHFFFLKKKSLGRGPNPHTHLRRAPRNNGSFVPSFNSYPFFLAPSSSLLRPSGGNPAPLARPFSSLKAQPPLLHCDRFFFPFLLCIPCQIFFSPHAPSPVPEQSATVFFLFPCYFYFFFFFVILRRLPFAPQNLRQHFPFFPPFSFLFALERSEL